MSESTADVIARMQTRYGMRAASPVTARRKASDASSGRANASNGHGHYPHANSLSSTRRGGRYPNTYRPWAKDYAGMDAPTSRPAWGSVKPVNGIRLGDNMTLALARAAGEDNGMRAEVARRHNLALSTGEMPKPGI